MANIPLPKDAVKDGTPIQQARYQGWKDSTMARGFDSATWIVIGNQQKPKCGKRLAAAYTAAYDETAALVKEQKAALWDSIQ